MRRTSWLAPALVAFALVLALATCGGGDRPTRPGEPTPPGPVSGVSMP